MQTRQFNSSVVAADNTHLHYCLKFLQNVTPKNIFHIIVVKLHLNLEVRCRLAA